MTVATSNISNRLDAPSQIGLSKLTLTSSGFYYVIAAARSEQASLEALPDESSQFLRV
jgi:hypothetical protein